MAWKEQLISTDVDRLLEYLADEGQVSVTRAAKDLDVSKDRINTWADALIEADLVERTYSTRQGKMLRIANREEAEKRIEEVQEDTKEELQAAQDETDPRKEEIQNAWETVQDLIEALEERKKIEQRIEEDIKELQQEEAGIDQEDDEIEEQLLDTLESIEDSMEGIEEIEDDIERFKDRKEKIEDNFKALKKLEEHRKRLKKREMEGNKCEYCGRIFDTERGLHVHQSQMHDDEDDGLLDSLRDVLPL